jgi:hypothetical protein
LKLRIDNSSKIKISHALAKVAIVLKCIACVLRIEKVVLPNVRARTVKIYLSIKGTIIK